MKGWAQGDMCERISVAMVGAFGEMHIRRQRFLKLYQ